MFISKMIRQKKKTNPIQIKHAFPKNSIQIIALSSNMFSILY